MDSELLVLLHHKFEDYVHQEEGIEFWYARELQELLGYNKWQNFTKIINKAMIACKNSNEEIPNHFTDISKMVKVGSGAERARLRTYS